MIIGVVVVTFNRLFLLKECIESLRKQTVELNHIIVINNGSTDGTLNWLMQQSDITYITQENSGSAGGQYTGIKTAYEKGSDWIWCMDDDGKPNENTLEKLIEQAENDEVILHPLVLAGDKNTFSFGCWLYPNTKQQILLKTQDELRKYLKNGEVIIPSYGTPFNGTLLPRKIIKKVGYPNPKYFIWGDESEFIKRIVKNGYKSYVVLGAIFIHPYNPLIYSTLHFEKKDWWKLYYQFRNKREIYYLSYNKYIATLKYLKQNISTILNILFSTHMYKVYKIKVITLATYHSLIGKYGKYDINKN